MINRRVEQLAARVAHNHKVAGSSPAPATESVSARVDLIGEYSGEPGNLISPPPEPGVLSEASGIFWRRVEMLSSSFAGWREQYRYR